MCSNFIGLWTFIQVLDSVLLGGSWGWELLDDHLQDGLRGVQPFLHDGLGKLSSLLKLPLIISKVDFEFGAQFLDLIQSTLENGVGKFDDWLENKLAESSLSWLALLVELLISEGFLFLVVEPITPHHASELRHLHTHSSGVFLSKLGDGETPLIETGTESDGTSSWLNDEISHIWDVILGNDDVDGVDNLGQFLVHGLRIVLELSQVTVHLVTK